MATVGVKQKASDLLKKGAWGLPPKKGVQWMFVAHIVSRHTIEQDHILNN